MLYILLDNGHGSNTPGKRSPRLPNGKQFFEWEFCREVVNLLYIRLKEYKEFTPIKITPESTDIPCKINSFVEPNPAMNEAISSGVYDKCKRDSLA